MTTQKIIQDFQNYMDNVGDRCPDWYVGITSDPKQRLFGDHGVDEQYGWIHAPGDTNEIARSVEKYFLALGCDGDTGGGDNSSKVVYAYRKNSHTNP